MSTMWHLKLQRRRDELGVSHRDIIAAVQEQSGIVLSEPGLTKYMNGYLTNPNLVKLEAICIALGITLSDLFAPDEDEGDEDRPNRQRPHTGKCEAARLLSAA